MNGMLTPIKFEIYSTGKFSWYWSLTLKSAYGKLDLERTGSCYTKRGAQRKVAKYVKRIELAKQTYETKEF